MPKPDGPAIPGKPPPLTMSGDAYTDLCELNGFLQWLPRLARLVQNSGRGVWSAYDDAGQVETPIPRDLQRCFDEVAERLDTAKKIVLTHEHHFLRTSSSDFVYQRLTELEAEIAHGQCAIDESEVARCVTKVWAAISCAKAVSSPATRAGQTGGEGTALSEASTEGQDRASAANEDCPPSSISAEHPERCNDTVDLPDRAQDAAGSATHGDSGRAGGLGTDPHIDPEIGDGAPVVPADHSRITMSQAAKLVDKSKKHVATVHKATGGPLPIIKGGGGKTAYYARQPMRLWLRSQFKIDIG